MSQRSKRQNRRWRESDNAYWSAVWKLVRRDMRRENGYLYVDSYDYFPEFLIWAHELKNPVLIHKGRKP